MGRNFVLIWPVNAPFGTNFEYSLDGISFQPNPIFSNLALGNYTVVLKNTTTGCEGTGTMLTLHQDGLAVPDVTAVATVQDCETLLTASSTTVNTSIVWNGPTLAADSPNPSVTTASGIYTATATKLDSGCTQDFIFTVAVPPSIALPTVTAVLPTCAGAIGSISVNGPLGSEYTYSLDGLNYQSGLDFLNLAPGIYSVTAKNSMTGCISIAVIVDLKLPILAPPVPTTTALSLCENSTATALAAIALPGATLNWYGKNATGGMASQTPPVTDTTVTGTYTYYCSQSLGLCESERIGILVTVHSATSEPDFEDLVLCLGAAVPALASVSPNGIEGSWQPNTISNTSSDSYIFTPEADACATVKTIFVTIVQPVSLAFSYHVDTDFAEQQTLTVIPDVMGDYLYQLDGGVFQTSPVFSGISLGMHAITMIDPDGCSNPTIESNILVLGYPRYFTPNNDGHNDTWSIKDLYYQNNATVTIFDRYGKSLTSLNLKNAEFWDGTYNGQLMPATDYWFTVYYTLLNESKSFSAHFSLIR